MELRLFALPELGPLELDNRIVMARLNRCRARGNGSNALMAENHVPPAAGFRRPAAIGPACRG